MKRVPTLMYEAEFQDFLDKQKRAVEEMKRDGLDYMSRYADCGDESQPRQEKRMKSASRPASWIRSLTWPNKNAPLNEAATSGALVITQFYCNRKRGKCK